MSDSQSSDDEEDMSGTLLHNKGSQNVAGPPDSDRRCNGKSTPIAPLGASCKFDAEWVSKKHLEMQQANERGGIEAVGWENVLEQWSNFIKDAPYERVTVDCVKLILQHARLTSASGSPMFYETLRRLGKDVLTPLDRINEQLLKRLEPKEDDSKWYRGFYGTKVSHLSNLSIMHE